MIRLDPTLRHKSWEGDGCGLYMNGKNAIIRVNDTQQMVSDIIVVVVIVVIVVICLVSTIQSYSKAFSSVVKATARRN